MAADNIAIQDWGLVPYLAAYDRQRELLQARIDDQIGDTIALVEHPPVYTLGLRPESQAHLLADEAYLRAHGIEVVATNRGGDITHHAPGQIVAYPIVRLAHRDLHRYLRDLEQALIDTLGQLGLAASRHPAGTGVWVGDRKIAAIGVAVRQWVTYHGIALNVNNDLSLFSGIIPCGLRGTGVTSVQQELQSAGLPSPSLAECKKILASSLYRVLGG